MYVKKENRGFSFQLQIPVSIENSCHKNLQYEVSSVNKYEPKKRKAAKVFPLATFSTVRQDPALCGVLSVFNFSFRSQYVLSTS